jgi:hypothetical protein
MRTGYIYEIKSIDKSINGTYIGSSWNIEFRRNSHYHSYNNSNSKDYVYPLYKYIRENGGWDNFEMTVIDSGEVETKLELECAEQFYIDMAGGVENLLNHRDPIINIEKRKQKQYENKQKNKKRYADNTREKLNTKFVCKCGGSYSHKHKSTHIKTNKHIKHFKNNK